MNCWVRLAYVKTVLDRVLAGCTDYEAIRPDIWRQAHPETIRAHRVEERLSQADAKTVKRAIRRVMVRR